MFKLVILSFNLLVLKEWVFQNSKIVSDISLSFKLSIHFNSEDFSRESAEGVLAPTGKLLNIYSLALSIAILCLASACRYVERAAARLAPTI